MTQKPDLNCNAQALALNLRRSAPVFMFQLRMGWGVASMARAARLWLPSGQTAALSSERKAWTPLSNGTKLGYHSLWLPIQWITLAMLLRFRNDADANGYCDPFASHTL